jgi:hypothetical protein
MKIIADFSQPGMPIPYCNNITISPSKNLDNSGFCLILIVIILQLATLKKRVLSILSIKKKSFPVEKLPEII